MSADRLHELLNKSHNPSKDNPSLSGADEKTDYEAVIKVLDVCRKVNIWNISFATLGPPPK